MLKKNTILVIAIITLATSFSNCSKKSTANCNNTCIYANDGECDEGTYCDMGTDCNDCGGSSGSQTRIYFRWKQDLSFPSGSGAAWCDNVSGKWMDENPAVPDYANEGTYYGPCAAGTYHATFAFDQTTDPSDSPVTYTLVEPANGYARYYTLLVRQYDYSLNRCLCLCSGFEVLTYYDQPL